jgi:hypothetical protein
VDPLVKLLRLTSLLPCFLLGVQATARVVISSPPDGASVASPVQVTASNWGRQTSSLSIYVDNSLVAQNSSSSSIESALNLNAGTYTIKVLAQAQSRTSVATSTIRVNGASDTPSSPSPTTPATPASPPAPSTSLAAQLANDMQGANEGHPHGVPLSYDWANGPAVVMGNNASGWQAITSWGALYEAAEGNAATNTRVNIRNMQTYLLQKSTGRWVLLQNTSKPNGEAYLEDFAGDVNRPADLRTESDGTVSATAGGGYNFHFYPSNRASINPNDVGGIVTILQARLIVADPNRPDDRSTARYLLNSGADYYPALTGGWPGNTSYNPGVALGKMKYVKAEWRSFAMTTISQSQLELNPPPVDLSGILP